MRPDAAGRDRRAVANARGILLCAAMLGFSFSSRADTCVGEVPALSVPAEGALRALYRRFPTRDALLAAILDEGTAAIVARGKELLTARSPRDGLTRWLEALAVHVTRYRGLTGLVAEAYGGKGDPLCRGCDAISGIGETLVRRAQHAGELRADALPHDIVLAAHAAAWVGEQSQDPAAPKRLLATVMAGYSAASLKKQPAKRASRRRTA